MLNYFQNSNLWLTNEKKFKKNSKRGLFFYKTQHKQESLIETSRLLVEEANVYLYILDISRDLTEKQILLLEESLSKENLFIYQPKGSEDLVSSISELEDHAIENPDEKHILLLNDWESICYLFQANYHYNGIIDILHKLKLTSDHIEVQILANTNCKERGLLIDWSNSVFNLSETGNHKVNKDTITLKPETKPLIANNFDIDEQEETEELPVIDNSKKEEYAYKLLKERLLKAEDKSALLSIRRIIQSFSSNLAKEQKEELNVIYRGQLEVIKTKTK